MSTAIDVKAAQQGLRIIPASEVTTGKLISDPGLKVQLSERELKEAKEISKQASSTS